MNEWHFVKDRDYPELKDHIIDNNNYPYSDLVIVYGKRHFVPDHHGEKDYYMSYDMAYYTGDGEWANHLDGDFDVIAWRNIKLTRPRRKK